MSTTLTRTDELFAWSDGRIVLLVERNEDCWIIARSWLQGDRMTDVRRWRFDCERRLVGQMRRLVGERFSAGADDTAAALADWLTAPVRVA
jgi:hypothetical protein